jgi:TRAP-type transport system periplasmic protein
MKHKVVVLVLAIAVIVSLVIVGCAQPAPAPAPAPTPTPEPEPEVIELKAVSFLPMSHDLTKMIQGYFDEVKSRSNGEISMNFVGGPEVISSAELGESVARGVVDIAITPALYLIGLVPQASATILSRVTQEEEMAPGGAHEYLQQYYNKAGLYFIGEPFGKNYYGFFLCTTDKKILKPDDLSGCSLSGSMVMYQSWLKEFGANLSVVPLPDAYTALERNMYDGYIAPADGFVGFGIHEALNYCVDHYFYIGSYMPLYMNLEKWNSLSEESQKLMIDTFKDVTPDMGELWVQLNFENYRQEMIDSGIEFIRFSDADSELYLDTVYDSSWDWLGEMIGSEDEAKLKAMLTP